MKRALVAMAFLVALPVAAADYDASYTPGAIPTLNPGQVVTVPVTVRNRGVLAWTRTTPNPFHLAYHVTGPLNVYEGERTDLPDPVVASGATVVFEARLRAPNVPGHYVIAWDMVHENRTWFSTAGVFSPTQELIVRAPLYLTFTSSLLLDAVTRPTIVDGSSSARPGSLVLATGRNFGRAPGRMSARVNGAVRVLGQLVWSEVGATARLDSADFRTFANDPHAVLFFETSDGRRSNEWTFAFTGTPQVVRVPADRIQMAVCGPSGLTWGAHNLCDAFKGADGLGTGRGLHDFPFWENEGSDLWRMTLPRGWRVHHVENVGGGSGSIHFPTPYAPLTDVEVAWRSTDSSPRWTSAIYELAFYAIGPPGERWR